jgi:hypothetical protein
MIWSIALSVPIRELKAKGGIARVCWTLSSLGMAINRELEKQILGKAGDT